MEGYAPAVGGMAEVVRQLSERMVKAGHEVTVLTTSHPQRPQGAMNGVNVRGFRISGNAMSGLRGETMAYRAALRDGGFDIITFFAAQQWATDAALDHLNELPGRKVLVPTGFSALHDPRWADYYARMPEWLARMDLVVLHNEGYQDAVFAQRDGITRTVLIPNGAAEEEFEAPLAHDFRREHGIGTDQQLIAHIGGFTGLKGQREALGIFIEAAASDAVLALIGNGIGILERAFKRHWRFAWLRARAGIKGKRILFLELDRARTVSALRQADLFLFPSRVECSPIVLFEAMASRVPFMASEVGNCAEIARWSGGGWIMPSMRGRDGLTAIDAKASARMLEALLADRGKLKAAGDAGHRAWKERFTWRAIADRYLHAYANLLKQP